MRVFAHEAINPFKLPSSNGEVVTWKDCRAFVEENSVIRRQNSKAAELLIIILRCFGLGRCGKVASAVDVVLHCKEVSRRSRLGNMERN